MCYSTEQYTDKVKIEKWYDATFLQGVHFEPAFYNGFTFPETPVILNRDIHTIELFHWGLIPFWAKDVSIRKQTLNAKIETLAEKASFKNSLTQRCLVLVSAFYEWKWLDEKGKHKEKYRITFPDEVPFALAGLYNTWTNKLSGEIINTYTIVTTEANSLMAEIHNTKKRMPVMLKREDELPWLQGQHYHDFALFNEPLVATKV